MSRVRSLVLVMACVVAAPAAAVDITGTWSMCLSGGGVFCPATITAVLESSAGRFRLDFQDSPVECIVEGAVDAITGVLTVDDTDQCSPSYFASMAATATDTSITGTFTFLLCPEYTLSGVPVCGTCDDGNDCTVDGCGATACSAPSSSCTEAPLQGTTCSDGVLCTTGDTCSAGTCGGTPVVCGDGNPCTDDMCDGTTGSCVFVPNSQPCNDGTLCTTNDTCAGGACVGGSALECAACETCRPLAGCVVGPAPTCKHSTASGKSKLQLRTTSGSVKDKLSWTWASGEATTPAELGDPASIDDYTLCVFDAGAAPVRRLLMSTALHGASCDGGSACWTGRGNPPGTKGWVYRDSGLLLPDGLKSAKLTPGAAGRSRAKVRGKGVELGLPAPLDVALPVTVQLQGANGVCFESVFTDAQVSREDLFRATASQ